MTMTLIVAMIGAGFGYGLFLFLRALQPKAIPLSVALHDLSRRRPSVAELATGQQPTTGVTAQLAARGRRFAVSLIEATGLIDMGLLETKLRIIGRPIEVHATHKILGAAFGLTLGLAGGVLLPLFDVPVSPAVIVSISLMMAVAGWVYPDLPLGDEVEARQTSFRHALSSYVDLVSSDLAGGIGLETALNSAAEAGDGWACRDPGRPKAGPPHRTTRMGSL